LLRIETLPLEFRSYGLLCVFKRFIVSPNGRRHEIVAALSIPLFVKKPLNETRQGANEALRPARGLKESRLRFLGYNERINQHFLHTLLLVRNEILSLESVTLSSPLDARWA
jgi:hypothetical protein